MPGVTVTLNDVTRNVSTGAITAKFSDGSTLEYADWDGMKSAVGAMDTDAEAAKQLLLLSLVGREPDGANIDALNGANCTIDRTANVPVAFSGLPD